MDASITEAFFGGLAAQLGREVRLFDEVGTTVIGREGRAGTGSATCYWVGRHAVVWCDPALEESLAPLLSDHVVSPDHVDNVMTSLGLDVLGPAIMHGLDSLRDPVVPPPAPYVGRALTNADVELVRAFTERCEPSDVDAVLLGDLDEFDESGIRVAIDPAVGPDHIVAYASAMDWGWNAAFADIGVLVHGDHRRRGLAQWVVHTAAAALLEEGRLPLYRHDVDNLGSAAVARSVGFEPLVRLAGYRLPS
ncbi:MAG: GNAT family N-acetyltransferase [Ilumatobacteraceae bacterium]